MALLKTVTKFRFKLHDTTRSAKFLKKKVFNGAISKRILSPVNESSICFPTHLTCTRSDQLDYLSTTASTWLPAHEMVYLITCTQQRLSDYLYTTASIWLPVHNSVYLITCTQQHLSDYLYTTASIWLPVHNSVYLITCTQQRLSDYLHTTASIW